MKRVGELMAELGFREDAPESLKEALVAGLMKSLTPPEVVRVEAKNKKKTPKPNSNQLSFFDELEESPPKKDDGKQAG